jgi:type VI secretion system protein ImpK
MGMSSPNSPSSPSSPLYWSSAELLTLAQQLAAARDLPPPDVLRQRIIGMLDELAREARQQEVDETAIGHARYALAAHIDEQILRSTWPGRPQWMSQPLQLTLFGENTAGEGFFTRLDALMKDEAKRDALEVYYLCLVMGFEGRYAMSPDADALPGVVETVARALGRGLPPAGKIAPHGEPTDRTRQRLRREAPMLAYSLGFVVLGVAAFLALKLSISALAGEAATELDKMTQGREPVPAEPGPR